MIYRNFKGQKLSQLGFGCMRFASDPETGEIDQAKVNAMFDLAIREGVNYFDTAYPYLGGKSEIAMAEALSGYPRESYYLADKFPGHSLTGPIDNIALFNVSLRKCRTDYFDFYLLHNVTEWSVQFYESEEYHIIPDLLQMKKEGKIRYFGFSCHAGPDMLDAFLTRHEGVFDFVQIQLNYLDWTMQDAKIKCDIIRKHGLGIWVMEPVRGGKLAVLPESESAKLRALRERGVGGAGAASGCGGSGGTSGLAADGGAAEPSDASYAFRFLQDLPGVTVILSGMNEVFQVEDNLRTFREENPLSDEERSVLLDIAENLKKGVPCTACRYCCDGCPMELDIPYLLQCYNDYKFATTMTPSMRIDALPEDKRPSACIGCGQCMHACPQGIDVPSALAELAEMYEKGPHWGDVVAQRAKSIEEDLK
ncbi:MAG: aldo/keto reductase [Lachnospiraceae bacterium]|nr:aldo/keto reductase [Lachnospiraceae bacterium]